VSGVRSGSAGGCWEEGWGLLGGLFTAWSLALSGAAGEAAAAASCSPCGGTMATAVPSAGSLPLSGAAWKAAADASHFPCEGTMAAAAASWVRPYGTEEQGTWEMGESMPESSPPPAASWLARREAKGVAGSCDAGAARPASSPWAAA
jgi:hypothetical protein